MIPALALATALGAASHAPQPVSEPQDNAQRSVARADELYAGGYFAEASAAYAEAYEADPVPDYLYGWAQAERRAGNCARAAELYREFVALDVSDGAREAATKNAQRCGVDLDVPAPPETTAEPLPPKDSSPAEPTWTRDVGGLGLVTAGGALGVAAIVLAADTARQHRLADESTIESGYIRRLERARRSRVAAIVCGSLGGAILVAGIVKLTLTARKEPRRVSWSPGRGLRF